MNDFHYLLPDLSSRVSGLDSSCSRSAPICMVIACRAYGLRAIDGPFGDFSDPEGYKDGARRAAALGCEGKWAIHPSQIALANEVFSPPEAEINRAHRIIAELKKAESEGRGAASLDGKMIDAASEKMARNVLVQAEAIAVKAA